MHARCARVNDTLGNPLMIEMGDLLTEDEILQQRGAARAGPERVLIIGKCEALVGGERRVPAPRDLMQLAARCLVCVFGRRGAFFRFAFSRITRCLCVAHDRSPG